MAVAVCIEKPTRIVRRICASGAAIPKGTLMKLTSPNTVAASDGDDQPFGGITIEEKVSTETDIVNIGCAMDGVWDIDTTAAAITVGVMVNMSAANQVAAAADADFEKGSIVGKAEEVRAADDRIRVRLMGF